MRNQDLQNSKGSKTKAMMFRHMASSDDERTVREETEIGKGRYGTSQSVKVYRERENDYSKQVGGKGGETLIGEGGEGDL